MITELLLEQRSASWHHAVYRPRMSQNGRCLRAATYDRLGFEPTDLPDPETIGVIEDGNLHEADIIAKFRKLGIEVQDIGRMIEIPANTHTGLVRGKTDFTIILDPVGLEHIKQRGIPIPAFLTPGKKLVEAKSIGKWLFEHLNAPLEAHLNQTQMYLHELVKEGIDQALILYKCRDTANFKEYWIEYEPIKAIEAMIKFEKIEEHAKNGVLPPRVTTNPDEYPCNRCEFKTPCWEAFEQELKAATQSQIPQEWLEKVKRYDEIRKIATVASSEKEDLGKELKLLMTTAGLNFAHNEEFTVAVRLQEREGNPNPEPVPPSKTLVIDVRNRTNAKKKKAALPKAS